MSVCCYAVEFFAERSNRFSWKGKHVLITGGSDGLGLELAKMLIQEERYRTKSITLVARSKDKLVQRQKELQEIVARGAANQEPLLPQIRIQTGDVGKKEDMDRAITETEAALGDAERVHVVVAAAGFSDPRYFEDLKGEDFERAMRVNYMGVVHAAQAFLKASTADRERRFIAVSSCAAQVPFLGYAAYSPSKAAVRAFCDVLRNEFADVPKTQIHICYPPDMDTPGFAVENESKPEETKRMWPECFNEVFSPKSAATAILSDVEANRYHLHSPDLFANFLNSRAWGHHPRNHVLLEMIIAPLFVLAHELMVWMCDRCVRNYKHHGRANASAPAETSASGRSSKS